MKLKLMIVYFLVLTLVGFLSMGIDKRKAVRKQWRIKERTLFLIAILGGSLGTIFGMQIFRHKTKHKSFTFGIPCILIGQILVLIWLV